MGFVTSRTVTLVQLNFIDNVCQIFEDFLKSFQSDEPQIHRLNGEMGKWEIVIQKQFLASFGCLNPQKILLSKPSDMVLIAKKLTKERIISGEKCFPRPHPMTQGSILQKHVLKMALSPPHGKGTVSD